VTNAAGDGGRSTAERSGPKTVARPGRVRTPTLLQMEAAECGAAALGIVLGHFGKHVPLEQLRKECGVSRNGSNAAGILRTAKAHGLDAHGFQMEAEVARKLPPPFIVFWNFKHFLVIEGFRRNKVLLNDPATGRRTVAFDAFDGSFTGVALQFENTAELEPGGHPPGSLIELRERLSGSAQAVGLVLFVSLLLAVTGTALPGFQRVFIDRILGGDAQSWLGPLLALVAVVALVVAGLTLVQQRALLRLETKMSITTSSRFLEHLLRLPMDFFSQRQAADLSSRVTSNDQIAKLLSRELATALVSALVAGAYAVLLITTDLVLAAIGIGLAVLNLLALRLVARLRRDATGRLQQDRGKLVAATYNGISMVESLKASGREGDYFARWAGLQTNVVSDAQRLGVSTQVLGVIPLFLATVNTALILWVGSRRAIDGVITIGLLVAFQTLLNNFTKPISDLSDLGARAQEASAEIARVRDVERYPAVPVPDEDGPVTRHRLSGALELENVTFGYSPLEAPFIEDFSLSLAPGARVALVGTSGSGKSTVARLIAGLLEPWSGEIRIDGVPRTQIQPEVLGASRALVDQEIVLFEGTVRDNLTLWDDTIADPALMQALRDAALLEEILARPGRLNATLRENAKDLSGGQRQRLEIARALAVEPTLLILDEATSALDAESERKVHESIRRRGCSCLIVAHRLSTVRDCSEILVMEQGRVVERGTHDEMKDAGGPYARLVALA
jgi:NHLM bacteriocin system ABC transporter peptidase/ATP-binding protein